MTPTPAQIDAALKAANETVVKFSMGPQYITREAIVAALTAAAEARDTFTATAWLDAEKKLETIEAETIERCAQVADNFIDPRDAFANLPGKIAAAIRALATEQL